MTTQDVLAFICHISPTRRAARITLHVGGEAQSSSHVLGSAPQQRWKELTSEGERGRGGESRQDVTGQDPAGGRVAWRQSRQEEDEEKLLPRRKSKRLSQAEFNPVPQHTVTEGSLIGKDIAVIQHGCGCSRFLLKTAFVTLLKRCTLSFVFDVKFLANSNVHEVSPHLPCTSHLLTA